MMFLDTSGLFSYLDASDANHSDAVRFLSETAARLTHSYVLAELVALSQARRLNRAVTLAFANAITDSPEFEMIWVGESEHRAAMALLEARADKTYSLCDAVSFVVMKQRRITDALTTDHHFEQEGFKKLLGSGS